jgi:proteasome accessory factor A
MSETTTLLKVATTELFLRVAESGKINDRFTIENPIRSIRDISSDKTFKKKIRLTSGREVTALQLQNEMYECVMNLEGLEELLNQPLYRYALDLWRRTLDALEQDDFKDVDKEIDWMIKEKFLHQYQSKNQLSNGDTKMSLLDISYHNIRKDRGLFYILEKSGLAKTLVKPLEVTNSTQYPPKTTRAALRGRFIQVAQEKRRDFTVDWVNMKINDQHQKSVACKDPFLAVDERVEKLIEAL